MRPPEQLGPYRYVQSKSCFPLGQDSLLLADFVTLRQRDVVWDLGCGAGALLLLLAARQSAIRLFGVELSPQDSALARKNLADNGLTGTIYTGDIRTLWKTFPSGCCSLAVSNPPYFKANSGGQGGPARTEGATLADWCAAAGRLVKNGGRFALVHRPERLGEIFSALQARGLEPKRMQLIQHDHQSPPSAVLVEAVRQGRPGLEVLPTKLIHRRE